MAATDDKREIGTEELVRRLKRIPGVQLATAGKLRGARRPIRIKPGEKTLAEIVIEDRR